MTRELTSVDVDSHTLLFHFRANDKTSTLAKPVNELNHLTIAEHPSQSGVCKTKPKPLGVLSRNRRTIDRLRLPVQNNHGRLANMQSQLVRTIGMKQMQEVVHRIHALQLVSRPA